MKRSICLALGAVFALGVAGQASAVIVIDNFTQGDYNITTNSASPTQKAIRDGDSANIIGGQRDAFLTWNTGPQNVRASVFLGGGGVQFFNSDSQTDGTLVLQYDGDDAAAEAGLGDGALNAGNGLNADFTGYSAFAFDWRFVDGGAASNITLTIEVVSNGMTYLSGPIVVPGSALAYTQIVSFASIGGGFAADPSNIERITFSFSSAQSADFTLDNIRVVPGPAAILPFMIGLAGAARRRARK